MFRNVRVVILVSGAVALSLGLLAPPSWGERIWDSELKRYLTDQEMTAAEAFMTEEEAVKLMLPNSERIRKEVIRLSQSQKIQIEERIGWKFPEDSFEVYLGETSDKI